MTRPVFRPQGPAEQVPPDTDSEIDAAAGSIQFTRDGARFPGIAAGRGGYVVIAFTAFLLVLLWGATSYELIHDKLAVIEGARTDTGNLARAYAEHVAGTVRLLDQALLRVKAEYEKGAISQDLSRELRDAPTINADSLFVAVSDEQGNVVASTQPLPPHARFVGKRDYFLAHAQAGPDPLYISVPLNGQITGKQIIVLSRALTKPDGAFAGVVFVSLDPQYLSGFFSDLSIGKESSFSVVGRDMIVRDLIKGTGRVRGDIGQSLARSQLAVASRNAPSGSYEAVGAINGVRRIFSYRAFADYPLLVVASIAEADVLADYRARKAWLISVAAGLSLFFVGVAYFQLRGLTLQLRSQRVLSETQELLIESQSVAKLGYMLRDVPRGLIYWSDSLFELRGVPRRAVFTMEEARQFVEPEDRARYTKARNEAIAARRPFSIDVRTRRPDGTRCWEHRAVHPHFDAHGKLTRVLTVVQDITERKENELELSRSRDNMARAQQVAALGSFERDLVTGAVEWSDEMYRILGIEKGAVAPDFDVVRDLMHPDDRETFVATNRASREGIARGMLEFRIIRPDGSERIIRSEIGFVRDENQKPVRLYGSYQDITEERAAEERERELERKLLHSQKLEALGTLAGGMAHDLNNTLTPIMALSKVTAKELPAGSVLRENLDVIFAASQQARDLVKRVLAFSRRDKITKEPANLRDIVESVLKLLRATIPTSIQLDTRIGDVPTILADASQIQQVVTNLVTNAAQAIVSAMGVITVTLEFVSGSAQHGAIRLSVADTGVGMDEVTQRRIFEPFFTTKQVGVGTGLGLSMIEGIVAEHGGRIEVASEVGKGARFDVYFPLPDAGASAAA